MTKDTVFQLRISGVDKQLLRRLAVRSGHSMAAELIRLIRTEGQGQGIFSLDQLEPEMEDEEVPA